MYQTILVAYDDSDPAKAGVKLGARLAARLGARIVIANVVQKASGDPDNATLESDLSDKTREKCNDAEAILARAGEIARNAASELAEQSPGTTAEDAPAPEVRVAIGHEGDRLIKLIEDESAELVVAGTHGIGHAKQVLLGSVSQKLLDGASADVLFVRGHERTDTIPSVLVAWDGSEDSTAAAAKGRDLSNVLGSKLIVSHVESYEAPFSDSPFLSKSSRDSVKDELHERSKAMVEKLREELGMSEDEAIWEAREGHDREQMVAVADEHEPAIAVVGTRRAKGVKGLLSGSVTRDLLDYSSAPVLVVRPGG